MSQAEVTGWLQCQNCHFPTAIHKKGSRESIGRQFAFDRTDPGRTWGRDETKLTKALGIAWAVLLHQYVQNEHVCFATLFGPDILHYQMAEPASSMTPNITLSSYWVHATDILEGVRLFNTTSYAITDLMKRQINTAIVVISQASEALPDNNLYEQLLFERYPFDLVLTVYQTTSEILILYRRPYVSTQYAAQIAQTFEVILQACMNQTSLLVNQLDTVTDSSGDLLISWNPSDPFTAETKACLHHLVEAQARETPHDQAVCAWDGFLTYNQLDQLANAVSVDLVMLGIGVGDLVPFALEKTKWSVIVTLAILKTGAAFVPLNPSDPKARLGDLLKAVSARAVITMESLVGKFEGLVDHVLFVSADVSKSELIHCKDQAAPEQTVRKCQSQPNDPVFVLFTSGSTGTPKGMVHEHAAICTHALVHGQDMAYRKARVLQFAAHTFDIAITDIFTTLLYGGCVCIPSEEDRQSDIVGAINKMRANYVILTPSFARLIEPTDVPSIKTLVLAGEALPQDLLQRWADSVRLIQVYGPAEVGICHTNDMDTTTQPETIGYPLSNSSCWLVDSDDSNRLVPIGAIGELVVGGPSLAREYIHNEAKTRDSFIHQPKWAKDFGLNCLRFYKTGDLLRHNLGSFDGSYDFVGRKDHQVKLRGQRIEPGEVEHHLGQIPGIGMSMVLLPEDGCYAGKLVAVIEMQGKRPFNLASGNVQLSYSPDMSLEIIHDSLSRSLPAYMIPAVCLTVANIPLVPSLKMDRRRVHEWLKDLKMAHDNNARAMRFTPSPREPSATIIYDFIVKVVRNGSQARVKSFGGSAVQLQQYGLDSIQVVSLAMFIRKKFSRAIPLTLLLSRTLTITELAAYVDSSAVSLDSEMLLPITSANPRSFDVLYEVKSLQKDLNSTCKVYQNSLSSKLRLQHHNIFLTGATGYLGTAILCRLLVFPHTRVFVLVRCKDLESGRQRVIESAMHHKSWNTAYAHRLFVWPGDLGKPGLGLQPQQLAALRGDHIDAIIHNGAHVHYSTPYTSLKKSNVLSTLFLLNLTAHSPSIRTFVFVSGGENPDLDSPITDGTYTSRLNERASGYTLSKVVSENLVRYCAEVSAKRFHIVKPGYVIGSATNGIAKQSDFLWRLVAGCVEIGAYNADEVDRWLFVSDSQSVATRVIEGLSGGHGDLEGGPPGRVRVDRVLDGLKFRELWQILRLQFGYDLVGLGWEQWLAKLRARVLDVGEGHKLFPLVHILECESNAIGGDIKPQEVFPEVRAAVQSNVRYLIDVGFLPAASKNP